MIKKVVYVEPADYIPKDLRKKYKLGEFAETEEKDTEKEKGQKDSRRLFGIGKKDQDAPHNALPIQYNHLRPFRHNRSFHGANILSAPSYHGV